MKSALPLPTLLQLSYKEDDLYPLAKKLLHGCYELTQDLPKEVEKNLGQEMRRSSMLAFLSVAQAVAQEKKKKKRKKLLPARDCLLIIDAILEVLLELELVSRPQAQEAARLLGACNRAIGKIVKK